MQRSHERSAATLHQRAPPGAAESARVTASGPFVIALALAPPSASRSLPAQLSESAWSRRAGPHQAGCGRDARRTRRVQLRPLQLIRIPVHRKDRFEASIGRALMTWRAIDLTEDSKNHPPQRPFWRSWPWTDEYLAPARRTTASTTIFPEPPRWFTPAHSVSHPRRTDQIQESDLPLVGTLALDSANQRPSSRSTPCSPFWS